MAGGQQFTAGQGSFGSAVTVALVGIALACSQGDVIPTQRGQQATFSQGSVTPSLTVALVGEEITSGAGNPSGSTFGVVHGHPALTGQSVTTGTGTVYPSGNNVTVNISGVEATFAQGTVAIGPVLITGIEAVFAQGAFGKTVDVPLIGIAATCAQGNIQPGIEADDTYIQSGVGNILSEREVALVGSEITAAQGTMSTENGEASLTGSEISSAIGTTAPDLQILLTGQEIVSALQTIGAPGGATLTGSEISVQQGIIYTDDDRSYALTGQSITVAQGITFASSLAFVTGQELDIQQQEIGPRGATLVGQQINSDQGRVQPPIPPEVLGATGGWPTVRRKKKKFYETVPTPEEIEEERIRLGILPKRVQKAVERVIAKASGVETKEQATNLAAAYFEEEMQRKLLERLRTEVAASKAKWQDEVFTVAHAMIIDELQKRADREELARMLAAKAQEEEEINDVLELWLNL